MRGTRLATVNPSLTIEFFTEFTGFFFIDTRHRIQRFRYRLVTTYLYFSLDMPRLDISILLDILYSLYKHSGTW